MGSASIEFWEAHTNLVEAGVVDRASNANNGVALWLVGTRYSQGEIDRLANGGEPEPWPVLSCRVERSNCLCRRLLALPVAVCAISPLHAWAQEPVETNSPVVGKQADAQIIQLLDKVEALVRKGQITSPAGDNAAEFFAQVLTLVSTASPAGLQRLEGFSLVLKQRALAEQAAGNKETSLWYSVFSEVAAVDPAAFPHVPPRSGTTPADISVPVEPRSGGEAAAE